MFVGNIILIWIEMFIVETNNYFQELTAIEIVLFGISVIAICLAFTLVTSNASRYRSSID